MTIVLNPSRRVVRSLIPLLSLYCSISVMGNSSSGAIEVDDNPLRKEERESVKELYSSFLQGGKVSRDRFAQVFVSLQYPSFSDACWTYICAGESMTFELFQKFVINGARSNSAKTVKLLWDIILCDPIVNNELTMEYFFRILLEFSGCDQGGIDVAASRLACHAHNYARLIGNEQPLTSSTLIAWTNDYAPHTYKVFVTYLNRKCFPRVELQSSIQFHVPYLDGGSAVVSQCDIMPLALYDTTLQGRWIKLYTTQADGLSFNRIAHHILGYGVSVRLACVLMIWRTCNLTLGIILPIGSFFNSLRSGRYRRDNSSL